MRGVNPGRGHPADQHRHPAALDDRRDHGAAEMTDQGSGLGRLGRGGRVDDDDGGVAGRIEDGRYNGRHAWHARQPGVQGFDRVPSGHPGVGGHIGGDDQRAVEPGPEPARQQVVSLAGGVSRRVVAGVGERQPHREQR